MYCRQCGFNNDKYTRMCRRCGSDLYGSAAPPPRQPPQKGMLLREKPRSTVIDDIKRRFSRGVGRYRRMSRARKMMIIYVCAGVLAFLLIALGSVSCYRSCNAPEPDLSVYVASGNTANVPLAASDGEYIYYSLPYGDNPGLYRVRESGGAPVKLSYRCLRELSCRAGYVYGVDQSTGEYIRILSNGLGAETLLPYAPEYVNMIGSQIYFVHDGDIYTADLDSLPVRPALLLASDVSYLTVEDGYALYVDAMGVQSNEITDAAGLKCGLIKRMSLETLEVETLFDAPADMLTCYGEYVFFAVPDVQVFEYTYEEEQGKGKNAKTVTVTESRTVACAKFMRMNLMTGESSGFLESAVATTPLNVTADGIYFVGFNGTLQRVPFGGGEPELVPAMQTGVKSVTSVAGWLYFECDGSRIYRIAVDGVSAELLCERTDYQQLTAASATDVSNSDAPANQ